MRRFNVLDRVIVDFGCAGTLSGHVILRNGDSYSVATDGLASTVPICHWSNLVHEPTDGTVPVEYRAMSSGALKAGW